MSYETLNEEPLYLTGQDAAFVRNLLKNPSGFLDEYMETGRITMGAPKAAARFAMLQPTTFGQSGVYGTLSGDWVDRMQDYAAAKARGDRAAAFAAISAEIKAAGGNGNVIATPLQFSSHDVGALAIGVANTRREAYKDFAIAAGVPTSVVDAEGKEQPRDVRDIAKDFKVKIGSPVPYIKAESMGVGAPIVFSPASEICTEEHLRNVESITAQHNAATNTTEFRIPVAAAMKIIGQSMLQKERETALYHAPIEAPIVPVSAAAVKTLEKHLDEVNKSGIISAIDAKSIGEHMCNDSKKCFGEAHFDNLFVGQKKDVGTSINDVISAAYNVFSINSQSPFSEKSEIKLRETIGAAQGTIVSAKNNKNAPLAHGVNYEMYVGSNYLPNVGYHLDNPTKSVNKKKGVFEHETIGEHYAEMPGEHAVISAKMSDGTVIDTMILPVAGGVKIIGGHIHGGKKDGKHRKARGHTAYDSTQNTMGMLY